MTRKISPPLEEFGRLRTPLTEGEQLVFEFLNGYLPCSWEMYVQPHLNGLRPDFVLLHSRVGVAVIEVKDWNLDAMAYSLEERSSGPPALSASKNGGPRFYKENPVETVSRYRREIHDLYCPRLDRQFGLATITGVLTFPFASQEAVDDLLAPALSYRAYDDAKRRYLRVIGRESLEGGLISHVIPDACRAQSSHMSPELASDLRHWLEEPEFAAEQRRLPTLNPKQRELVETRTATGFRRIRGPAGSGKSLCVAGRATTLLREDKDVLVVTFNHTLIQWLRDLTVRFGASPNRVTWLSFHRWCKRTMEELGETEAYAAVWRSWEGEPEDDRSNNVFDYELAEAVISALRRVTVRASSYDAILVDEGQDFLPEWWQALRGVLKPNGEMILVADTNQDIFERRRSWTDAAMTGAGFDGPWNQLDASYRMPTRLTALTRIFAEEFVDADAALLPHYPDQGELAVEPCRLRWVQVDESAIADVAVSEILQLVVESDSEQEESDPVSFADVVIVVDRTDLGREVCGRLEERNIHTLHTFAEDTDTARRQKQTFFKGDAKTKATTIHSFKGWEGRALVLLVSASDGATTRRLIYTGMTRLKRTARGSHLTVVCAAPELAEFGSLWDEFVKLEGEEARVAATRARERVLLFARSSHALERSRRTDGLSEEDYRADLRELPTRPVIQVCPHPRCGVRFINSTRTTCPAHPRQQLVRVEG